MVAFRFRDREVELNWMITRHFRIYVDTDILLKVRRIPEIFQSHKIFFDAPRTDKPIKHTHAPCLVVCPAPTRPAKRLLPYDRASALLVVIYVAGCVSELVRRKNECLSIGSESIVCSLIKFDHPGQNKNVHRPGQRILGCRVDKFKCLFIIRVIKHIYL